MRAVRQKSSTFGAQSWLSAPIRISTRGQWPWMSRTRRRRKAGASTRLCRTRRRRPRIVDARGEAPGRAEARLDLTQRQQAAIG